MLPSVATMYELGVTMSWYASSSSETGCFEYGFVWLKQRACLLHILRRCRTAFDQRVDGKPFMGFDRLAVVRPDLYIVALLRALMSTGSRRRRGRAGTRSAFERSDTAGCTRACRRYGAMQSAPPGLRIPGSPAAAAV